MGGRFDPHRFLKAGLARTYVGLNRYTVAAHSDDFNISQQLLSETTSFEQLKDIHNID